MTSDFLVGGLRFLDAFDLVSAVPFDAAFGHADGLPRTLIGLESDPKYKKNT
jgi:hypothetical protein